MTRIRVVVHPPRGTAKAAKRHRSRTSVGFLAVATAYPTYPSLDSHSRPSRSSSCLRRTIGALSRVVLEGRQQELALPSLWRPNSGLTRRLRPRQERNGERQTQDASSQLETILAAGPAVSAFRAEVPELRFTWVHAPSSLALSIFLSLARLSSQPQRQDILNTSRFARCFARAGTTL